MSYEKSDGEPINKEQLGQLQRVDLFMSIISLSEAKFISDLKHKFVMYGDRMYVSPKQMEWLAKLNDRLIDSIGPLAGAPALGSLKSPQPNYCPDDAEF